MALWVPYRFGMTFLDDSQFPLVRIRVPRTWETDKVLQLFEAFDDLAARDERCVVLMDLSESSLPPPDIRKMLGEKRKTLKPFFDSCLMAQAALVSSKALKGFLSLMNWLAPSEHPQKTFESEEAALAWLQTHLDRMSTTAAAG